jgi:trk system potassium uptake protein TrkA
LARRFAVIGLGNFGSWVTRTIFDLDCEVVAIDADNERVQKIKPYATVAIIADCTKKETLAKLGIAEMDAVVVSLGENVSASTLVTLFLREMGLKRILVKAVDEDHARILSKVGATDVIFPEKEIAIKVAKGLVLPNILDYLPMTGDYEIVELAPPNGFIGKTLRDLAIPQRFQAQVIAIKELIPENFVIIPPADFVIKDSDILIILGKKSNIERIKEK